MALNMMVIQKKRDLLLAICTVASHLIMANRFLVSKLIFCIVFIKVIVHIKQKLFFWQQKCTNQHNKSI